MRISDWSSDVCSSDLTNHEPWMGHRPCLPDSLPVIGERAWHQGLWFASGHGHLGLTASAKTGKLVAEDVTGVVQGLVPYSINRLSGSAGKDEVPAATEECRVRSHGTNLRGSTCV